MLSVSRMALAPTGAGNALLSSFSSKGGLKAPRMEKEPVSLGLTGTLGFPAAKDERSAGAAAAAGAAGRESTASTVSVDSGSKAANLSLGANITK